MVGSDDILRAGILIVDDQVPNVLMLEEMLRTAGYRNVSSTLDPVAVRALHNTHHYDLILLDLQMPGMDGFAVMADLKTMDADGYMPILAVTVQPSHKLRALASGARDFLAKPFDMVEAKTRIRNMIEVHLLYKKLEQSVRALESLALHDELTGLPNRRLLMDRLRQAMLTSARTGHHGAVMFLDLDHFKGINDTFGHDMGDLLLQQVAVRLHACVRDGDSVARLGGDEFVVLLEALGTLDHEAATQAEFVANKIQSALGMTYHLGGSDHDSTASIGIVVFAGDVPPIDDVLKRADIAMYQAKAAGRNAVRFFDPGMQAAVTAHDALVKDMRRGLAMQEFLLHYQIQVDSEGRTTGVEALVRWNHPARGLMLPALFIGLAEETGLILPLGHWVLATACAQLVLWAQSAETAHWTMAVNVSASQFAHPDFVALVGRELQKSGAQPALLQLELTESTLIVDVEGVIETMNAIKAFGVGFSLDDFGTGYSSLTYLKRLPLGQLKIDRSFVRDILTEPIDAVIAQTIVGLGKSLGMAVLAEGVETASQRDFLGGIGCSAFQGFFFGRPVAAGLLTPVCRY